MFGANDASTAVLRGFGVGSGGSAAVGGPKDGREGLGIAAAIAVFLVFFFSFPAMSSFSLFTRYWTEKMDQDLNRTLCVVANRSELSLRSD
jgi:hypothetical protein